MVIVLTADCSYNLLFLQLLAVMPDLGVEIAYHSIIPARHDDVNGDDPLIQ